MSYDLAVWEGTVPATVSEASAEYERRMDAMEAALERPDGPPPASPAIRAFVEAALSRYPALDEDTGPECPWASSPLIDEAIGDLIYFPLTFSGAEIARDELADLARAHGLVCYDPQIEALLPDPAAKSAATVAAAAHEALVRHVQDQDDSADGRRWWSRLFRRQN
ncbi:hypothetical protein [Angustibacter sp. Root456]|uniref:hypothetical protein n=1 Tax=Angustibacter sp. Root456 TaxID=1736539 RepID=UPI000701B0D4|nr:hypothetical protein [Angustibacter sp. Root456]KQX66197.1 hypothetical protein ASD06_07415 [Angustibacter sp. Root456]